LPYCPRTWFFPFVDGALWRGRALPRSPLATAAKNAKAAGFDGVELHGANGQFPRGGSNRRTDAYGGSVQNRAQFQLEVAEAVVGVWGSQSVGYKLFPHFAGYSMSDSRNVFVYRRAIE
jgi:N-ethylmaleimide reductase